MEVIEEVDEGEEQDYAEAVEINLRQLMEELGEEPDVIVRIGQPRQMEIDHE